MLVPKSMALT